MNSESSHIETFIENASFLMNCDKQHLSYIIDTIQIKGFDRTDLYHLISFGIPMYKEISEYYGIPMEEVKSLCESRTILSNDFNQILSKMVSDDGIFYIDKKALKNRGVI